MATLKDLSRYLDLSVTQVSRALNDHDDVALETKERVRQAAKALNYQPNVMARRLVNGRSGIVGLVWQQKLEPSESWIFAQFVGGLTREFNRLGLQLILNVADDEASAHATYERLVGGRLVDGFVLFMPVKNDARVGYLREHDVPFVVHGRPMENPDCAFFDIDNEAIGYDLTSMLIRKGHRKIAFINGLPNAIFAGARHKGYMRALAEAGIAPVSEYHVGGRMSEQLGLLETIRLFQSPLPMPTAIIASSMSIAKGVIEAVRVLELRIPRDLSLVVHDDCLPNLDVADFPLALSGTAAPLHDAWSGLAGQLNAIIGGARPLDFQEVVSHQIIEGASILEI